MTGRDPASLTGEEIGSLEAFLTFRGSSELLGGRIADIETRVQGSGAGEAVEAAIDWSLDSSVLDGARLAKRLSAQVDVVLHAAGILHSLPHVLEPDEIVQSVSLGAGNTGRAYDLETDRRIAEFKFIAWAGGSESVRQDNLLIDVFHLASADTEKRRVMYLTGIDIPLRWLRNSRRVTRACLRRKSGTPQRFDEQYGPDRFHFVHEYWAAVERIVEIVDLAALVPGLGELPMGER